METERICIDCAQVATNGESESAPADFAPNGLWALDFTKMDDDTEEFYVPRVPCPSCGTDKAGTWFHAQRVA